jgi:hypothetical protein
MKKIYLFRIFAKLHVLIIVLTLCGGVIAKVLNLSESFGIVGPLYIIMGSFCYVIFFKIFAVNGTVITKSTPGIQNKVYYFSSTVVLICLLLALTVLFE